MAKRRDIPAITPEAREQQMIALAVDLAEQQLRDGTATSQVITHYLKLGATNNQLEQELLKNKVDMMKAKTEQIKSEQRIEELYESAIKAMRRYRGPEYEDEEDLYDGRD